jgi:hypothetical protein
MQDEGTQRRHAYPGQLVSYEDGKTPMSQTRMFIGNCLANYDNAVVWFARERNPRGQWESGVLIVRAQASDVLEEVLLRTQLPDVSAALQRVRQGSCREVPGIDGHTEP